MHINVQLISFIYVTINILHLEKVVVLYIDKFKFYDFLFIVEHIFSIFFQYNYTLESYDYKIHIFERHNLI